MKFIFDKKFKDALSEIEEFIAIDSFERAYKFKNDLYKKIYNLEFMPKKCRKSMLSDDESVRDLIFKGYVVVFKVENEIIKVLYIYKENKPEYDFSEKK